MSLDEAFEGAVCRTRAFCRRQMTWFRHFRPALWYDTFALSAERVEEALLEVALRHLEGCSVEAEGCAEAPAW